MFGSIFVQSISEAILFKSAVIFVTAVAIFKTSYAIIVQIILLDTIKNR